MTAYRYAWSASSKDPLQGTCPPQRWQVLSIYTGGELRSTDEKVKKYVGASTSLGPSSPKRVNELDQMVSKSLIFISECCFYNHHVVPHITGMINP